MDYLKSFVIQFSGLSLDKHQFDYQIDDRFFENIEYSEIKKGDVQVKLILDKHESMLVLDFDIQGEVEVLCDRCADYFMQPIQGHERLIVKFSEVPKEETEDLITLHPSENKINISKYIYEYICLLLPYRLVHPEDENGNSQCDPEMVRRLSELSPHPVTDPRWDSLKNLNLE